MSGLYNPPPCGSPPMHRRIGVGPRVAEDTPGTTARVAACARANRRLPISLAERLPASHGVGWPNGRAWRKSSGGATRRFRHILRFGQWSKPAGCGRNASLHQANKVFPAPRPTCAVQGEVLVGNDLGVISIWATSEGQWGVIPSPEKGSLGNLPEPRAEIWTSSARIWPISAKSGPK